MATDVEVFPEPIAGLDIAAGLHRLDGDTGLYILLLRDFVLAEKSAADEIAAALAAGDLQSATRRVHTVKGLAGTFGAQDLYTAAMALEAALRQGLPPGELDPHRQSFAATLTTLIAELETKLPAEGEAGPVPNGPVDPLRVTAICRELALLVEDCDIGAGRVLEAHSGLLRAAFGDDYRLLEQALRQFHFDDAATVLIENCRKIGITISAAE